MVLAPVPVADRPRDLGDLRRRRDAGIIPGERRVLDAGILDAVVFDARILDARILNPGRAHSVVLDARILNPGIFDPRVFDAGILDPRILDARVRHTGHRRHVGIHHTGRVERELAREHIRLVVLCRQDVGQQFQAVRVFDFRHARIGVQEHRAGLGATHLQDVDQDARAHAARAHVDGARRAGSAWNRNGERAAIGARDTAGVGNSRIVRPERRPARSVRRRVVRLIGHDELVLAILGRQVLNEHDICALEGAGRLRADGEVTTSPGNVAAA